tara:strand:- start:21400 stop:31095 length:9696 start_codon:yes stop_codon:yes gene_type:complete
MKTAPMPNQPTIDKPKPFWMRAVATMLIYVLTLSPLTEAMAAVVVDGSAPASQQAGLDVAGNGVPVIQITAPTTGGVSMNQFTQFNIEQQGLILNNAQQMTQTQLGGLIEGNSKLTGGQAGIIVNQVNGGLQSQLNGYAEVAGQRAEVIIANPSGVTCDGCGFINTNRATLTTGQVQLDAAGGIESIRVSQGAIRINGQGLNASNVDRLDLMARSIELNAALHANEGRLIAGANQIDRASETVTPIAATGAAPTFALDVSAIGGMYANSIYMIGTEAGLGVNMGGEMAATGGLTLSADGTLSFGETSKTGAGLLNITGNTIANAGELTGVEGVNLSARQNISSGGTISSAGAITFDAGLRVDQSGEMTARNIAVDTATLHNAGSIQAADALTIEAGTLVNAPSGQLTSANSIQVSTTDRLDNQGTINAASTSLSSTATSNDGRISGNQLNMSTGSLRNGSTGLISQQGSGSGQIDVSGTLDNDGRIIGRSLALDSKDLDSSGIVAQLESGDASPGSLQITVTDAARNSGQLYSEGSGLSLNVGELSNTASGQVNHVGSGSLAIRSTGAMQNAGGIGSADIAITAGSLNNSGTIAQQSTTANASFAAAAQPGFTATSTPAGTLQIDAGAQLVNSGELSGNGSSSQIQAAAIHNLDNGLVLQTGSGQITITGSSSFINNGTIAGGGDVQANLTSNSASLDNQNGQLISGGAMAITAAALDNRAGSIEVGGDAGFTTSLIDNRSGTVALLSNADQQLTTATILNQGGQIAANAGSLSISSTTFDNSLSGRIDHLGSGVLTLSGSLNNNQGAVQSNGAATIDTSAAGLDNQDGTMSALQDLRIAAGSLDNRNGTLTAGNLLDLSLTGTNRSVTNTGGTIQSVGDASLRGVSSLNNTSGALLANDSLSLQMDSFALSGTINGGSVAVDARDAINILADQSWQTSGNLSLTSGGALTVSGLLQSGQALALMGSALTVDATGSVIGGSNADINIAGAVVNHNRISATDSLTLNAGSVNNKANIGGRDALINTDSLVNHGLVFGLDSLTVQARSIRNAADDMSAQHTNSGTLFSFGDMTLEGRSAGSRAQEIVNERGEIRAEGDLALSTDYLGNLGHWAQGETTTVTDEPIYDLNEFCWDSPKDCHQVLGENVRTTKTTVTREVLSLGWHGAASISAAGNLYGHTTTLVNDFSYIGGNESVVLTGTSAINRAGDSEYDLSTLIHSRFWKNKEDWTGDKERSNQDGGEQTVQSTATQTLAGATIESLGRVDLSFGDKIDNGTVSPYISSPTQSLPTLQMPASPANSSATAPQVASTTAAGPLSAPDRTGFVGSTLPQLDLDRLRIDPLQNNFQLPTGPGLFQINTNPNHPYLVETNPLLTDSRAFLSSSYLLDRLDWDASTEMRRIGDGFYEQNLIERSLQAATGSRYIDGVGGTDLMRQLMDNATVAYEDLELSPGVALTAAQVNRLTRSMVWMETRVIDGETVLVPVVYLAADRELAYKNGSLIAGGDIALTGDSDVVNEGVLRAQNTLTIKSDLGGFQNRQGRVTAGGALSVDVRKDLLNESGAISGETVRLEAGGDIRNTTLHEQIASSNGKSSVVISASGEQSIITARDTLYANAGGNIIDQAGVFEADGSMALLADGDIRFESVETATGLSFADKNSRQSAFTTKQKVGRVTAGENLILQSKGDMRFEGTQLSAGNDALLKSGGDIEMLAVAETDDRDFYARSDRSIMGSRTTTESSSSSVEHRSANLTTGGNLALSSEGDITLFGSQIETAGSASVDAAGRIDMTAAVDSHSASFSKSEENVAREKQQSKGSYDETAVRAGVFSGGDLSLDGQHVSLIGSDLASSGTLQIGEQTVLRDGDQYTATDGSSVETLTVGAVGLRNESWSEKSREYKGVVKELATGLAITAALLVPGIEVPAVELASASSVREESLTHQGSTVSGENVLITTGGTTRIEGSQIDATEQLQVDAGSIEIDAVADTHTLTTSERSETIATLGFDVGRDQIQVGGIQKTKTSETHSEASTTWAGSSLSGGNVSLRADESVIVLASDIAAANDADINAGTTLLIGGREDTHVVSDTSTIETTTLAAAVKNAYVDTAYAIQAANDARKAVSDAENALSEARDKAKRGELASDDLKYFEANLAAATANLAQAAIAVAGAGATAAASTPTGGFYATATLDRQSTTSESQSDQSVFAGSNISAGGSASLTSGEAIRIEGSNVNIAENLQLDSAMIDIVAGRNTSSDSSSTRQNSQSVTASYGSQGSGSFQTGSRTSSSDGQSLTHTNSNIRAGSLNSTSDALTIHGASVVADAVTIDTGILDIRSVQDTASSSGKTRGGTVGAGFSGGALSSVSASSEKSDSSSERAWTSQQTQLVGTDSITINAKDTTLDGAVVANASIADDGTLTDKGGLKLTTETLVVDDLLDTETADTRGINTGVTFNVSGQDGPSLPGLMDTGSTTIGGFVSGHEREQQTRATIGGGVLVVGGVEQTAGNSTVAVNRDLTQSQVVTVDRETGGLDASVTVDHRLLTEAGRTQIANQFEDSYEHAQDVGAAAIEVSTTDDSNPLQLFGTIHDNAISTQVKQHLRRSDPGLLARLNAGGEDALLAQAEINALAQAKFGLEPGKTLFYDGEATTGAVADQSGPLGDRDVRGFTISDRSRDDFGTIGIDVNAGSLDDLIRTGGHEVIETAVLGGAHSLFASNSHQAKEARANNFGERLSMRLGEASSSAGLQGADSGWTVAGDTTTRRQGLGNNDTVRAGTAQADTIGANQVEYRQFIKPEAQLLDAARNRITSASGLTAQQRDTALVQLNAIACAAVKCAEGVARGAPNYQNLRNLQTFGERLEAEQGATIAGTLTELGLETTYSERHGRSTTTGERFGYTFGDSANDLASRNEEGVGRVGQSLAVVGGATEVAGGGLLAAVTCTNPITCAGGIAGGALLAADGLATATRARAEFNALFQFKSDSTVLDSFSAETHPGTYLPWLDVGGDIGLSAVPALAGGAAAKLVRNADELKGAPYRANESTASTQNRIQNGPPGSEYADLRMATDGEMIGQGQPSSTKVVERVEAVVPDTSSAVRLLVEANIAESKVGTKSSKFAGYFKAEGRVQEEFEIWPPNRGAYGPIEKMTIQPGEFLDRYGFPGGTFVSPAKSTLKADNPAFETRALPSYKQNDPYNVYEVLKPIENAPRSKILPWFGQPGQGVQFDLPHSVKWYIENGYVKQTGGGSEKVRAGQ